MAREDTMISELVLLFILGLKPSWAPEYCPAIDMNQDICRERQEEGYAMAQQLATWFTEEGERQDLSPFILAAVAFREGSFMTGDLCYVKIPVDRIVSRTPLEDEGDDAKRERICITKRAGGELCADMIIRRETETEVEVDRCGAGEQGMMQLTSHETPAGLVIPATGEELPRNARERREMVIETHNNISLGALTLAKVRDQCCGDDEVCRSGYSYLQCYNSGSCTSDYTARYNSRISGHLSTGLTYVCERKPDAWFCASEGRMVLDAVAGPPESPAPAEAPAETTAP